LAKNTLFMYAGSGVRLVLQAIYFVLIARALGPSQYGAFIGAVALIGIATPFASLGFGGILIKNTARDRERFAESWGNALWITAIGGSLLIVLVLGASHFVIGGRVPLRLMLFVAFADLFCSPLITVAGQAFMAFEKLRGTASTLIVLSASRTACALFLATRVAHAAAAAWAALYLVSSAIAGIYAVVLVCREFGLPKLALSKIGPDLAEGFSFAIGASSQTIYNDIDKTMLVRLSELSAAGIYGTAYRLVDLIFQPVSALLYSSFARFFKAGENGISGSVNVARGLLPYTLAYGAAGAIALFFLSPVLPFILGHGFGESVEALRWLAPLAIIRPVHYMAANSLTGAGFQGLRAAVQVGVAAGNVALNFWLIPAYSWRGAAWVSLASDGALALGLWAAVWLLTLNHNHVAALAPGSAD
jgi:O-antigen/teichoic acid export membrane protein